MEEKEEKEEKKENEEKKEKDQKKQFDKIKEKDEKKENEEKTQEDQNNPAPSASFHNLDLNLKKLSADYSHIFFFVKGDITTMAADVIVNSSTPDMTPQMGVSKSIHNKCGYKLLKYLKSNYAGILHGGIVDSPPFGLKCKNIIHAVGPYQNNDMIRELETIYEQCLHYCFSRRHKSIIFPCISTGGSMFNEDRACMIAINACKNWIEKFGIYWKGKITFCCYTDKSYEVYKKYFKELLDIG